MKKLLLLLAASSAFTLTACGTNEIATKVTGSESAMTIGSSTYSKQEIYNLLKLSQGKEVVTNWFREAIYLDLDSEAEAKITARTQQLWTEFEETIWYPSTLRTTLATKKYFCTTPAIEAGCDTPTIEKYQREVIRPSAIDELFTEYYLQTNAKVEENYFKDYQPRNVWALQKDLLSNMESTVSRIRAGADEAAAQFNFAKEATYFHHGKSLFNNSSYYDTVTKKYKGNKLESYGKKGIVQDENWRGDTIQKVWGGTEQEWKDSAKYLKTGNIGVVLNTSSALPSSINKHLFNEGLAKGVNLGLSNEGPADGAYQGAWIDGKGMLAFKDTDGTTSRFFTETGDTHYVAIPQVIKYTDAITGADRLEARRQIAKVSAVKTKAQNQLFKKYEIEAWDQVIWDAIDATILGNKEDK